jgi:hypothetical protein
MKYNLKEIKYSVLLTVLISVYSKAYSQKKNEFIIQLGYSQASQSLKQFNLFQTSYWMQNIHNAFGNVEYYRNINKSAIGAGIQIVEKGFRANYTIPTNNGIQMRQRYFFKFNYLEIPLTYRYTRKRLFFNIGILGSYLIKSAQGSSTEKRFSDGRIQYSAGTSYNPKVFKKYDVGVIARIGMKITDKLSGNFTFTRGFLRPYIYNSGELNYNEVFLVGLSYTIN